ncbi:MAG: tetratricopeptide repeat protein [Planctomycetes bacterium]|nr:tetratricopeptide repeat protein [Planctomycetota bacterium]
MKSPCTTKTEERAFEPGTRIRRSRVGKWRALVLVLVNAAIVAHFVQWYLHGSTVAPIEPSEGMQFAKEGVINPGLIFFLVMILSTLVVGRWFCGWACHIVAVQDLAAWILKKLRLKPRHVDLGVLGWVPWLAFVYMFLAPIVWRLLQGMGLEEPTVQLMTESFWATFPNWLTALLTLLLAGMAIVWFLGSKGFCYYGCPYGGIFGVVDQLAPGRIRVTDACSGCGHCTAVCTSNVKVHQEVRDWKMVVDAGCMKCMDCVSVCPNDALYVGFGTPALFATRRTPEPVKAKPERNERGPWTQFLLLATFFVLAQAAFLASNTGRSDYEWKLTLALAGLSLVVALPFRGRQSARREYSIGEELLLVAVFLVALFGIRDQHIPVGLPGAETIDFPFLFALGLSAMFSYAFVQLVRLARRPNLLVQKLPLRANGRVQPAGVLFGVALAPLAGLVAWRAWVHVDTVVEQHAQRAQHQQTEAELRERAQRADRFFQDGVRAASENRLDDAERLFRATLELAPGSREARENLAGMLCARGRFDEGIALFREALAQDPNDPDTHAFIARALIGKNDPRGARVELEAALALAPARGDLHAFLAELCAALGDEACASEHARRAAELPGAPR